MGSVPSDRSVRPGTWNRPGRNLPFLDLTEIKLDRSGSTENRDRNMETILSRNSLLLRRH